MTNEEAITIMQLFKEELSNSPDFGDIGMRTLIQIQINAFDMAIHALRQSPNEDWERYSDFLWKEAYERGKQDALKGGDSDD